MEVLVCGWNKNFGISEKSNNNNVDGDPIIFPLTNSEFDPSQISSYSTYNKKTVVTTRDACTH